MLYSFDYSFFAFTVTEVRLLQAFSEVSTCLTFVNHKMRTSVQRFDQVSNLRLRP